jgi:hypothetical protein
MARVHVSDDTWTAYRAALGSTPVSVALGKLVERELAAHYRRTALDGEAVRDAVEDARRVAEELQTLIGRLEAANPEASRGARPEERWSPDSPAGAVAGTDVGAPRRASEQLTSRTISL